MNQQKSQNLPDLYRQVTDNLKNYQRTQEENFK